MFTLDHLKRMGEKYLETLNDESPDEWFDTNRAFARYGVEGLLEWLETYQPDYARWRFKTDAELERDGLPPRVKREYIVFKGLGE